MDLSLLFSDTKKAVVDYKPAPADFTEQIVVTKEQLRAASAELSGVPEELQKPLK